MQNLNDNKKFKNLKVHISGYGPFMHVKDNPSHRLVEYISKNKNKIHTELDCLVEIVSETIYDVSVDYVNEKITDCHQLVEQMGQANLNLIVHFGVNTGAKCVYLESRCKNYIMDYSKYNSKINNEAETYIPCKLDLESISKELIKNNHNVSISDDAGTYLCNFIYYKSSEKFIKCDNVITIFIHIPNIDVCSKEECERCFVDFLKCVRNNFIELNPNYS